MREVLKISLCMYLLHANMYTIMIYICVIIWFLYCDKYLKFMINYLKNWDFKTIHIIH